MSKLSPIRIPRKVVKEDCSVCLQGLALIECETEISLNDALKADHNLVLEFGPNTSDCSVCLSAGLVYYVSCSRNIH